MLSHRCMYVRLLSADCSDLRAAHLNTKCDTVTSREHLSSLTSTQQSVSTAL